MNNIKFKYLYRDGSNFKRWSEVIFSSPDGLNLHLASKSLEDAFEKDRLFIAHQVRIPEAFLYGKADANADDHCYHEFYDIEIAVDGPNDGYGRSLDQFIAEVKREADRGWMPFDPFDRWLRQSSSS